MTDRDTFAAAQRTCLRIDRWLEGDLSDDADQTLRDARCLLITLAAKLEYADAMLRERERVTEPMPKEKRAEVSSAPVFADKAGSWPVSYEKSDEKRVFYDTNHDAVPAAKAYADGEPAPECGAEAGSSPRDGTGDICERLRGWYKAVDAVPASDLMDEAADEIERLRGQAKSISAADIVQRLRDRSYSSKSKDPLVEEAADHIESLRREIRTQRQEIAALRDEQKLIVEADRPFRNENLDAGWIR